MSSGRPADDARGVSEVVGFTLVFALVLSLVALVSVVGFTDLDDTRENEQVNNAERAFDVVVDNVADLYRRGAPSRGTELRLADASVYTGDPITLNVTGFDTTTGDSFTTANISITPIVYEGTGNTRIVYSGGGLFRVTPSGQRTVRDLPFVVTDRAILLPIVQTRTRATQSVSGGTARILTTRSLSQTTAYDHTGRYDTVWVNVTSPRYELWAASLEETGRADCTVDQASASAACKLDPATYLTVRHYRIDVALER